MTHVVSQETIRRWIEGGCTCPVPRNRMHVDGCPYWAEVIADAQRVERNHAEGVYDV